MEFSQILLFPVHLVDKFLLFFLVSVYEKLMYKPLQARLIPVVMKIPRELSLAGYRITFFTANGVTYTRTSLLIVIAFSLKFEYYLLAASCVVANDLLDHLDGIVAIAQRKVYGNIDSPLFGAFIDAFCDKVVNVSVLWSMLLLVDLSVLSSWQLLAFVGISSSVITLECVIGVIRVQDYYRAKYGKPMPAARDAVIAGLEGKTKEKLENIGLSLLCLAMADRNPIDSWCGVVGLVCLGLSARFAIGSMLRKLSTRASQQEEREDQDVFTASSDNSNQTQLNGWLPRQQSAPAFTMRSSSSESEDDNLTDHGPGEKVDKIYTVGCFDLFHRGHRKLLRNMRGLGREVIVGIHNDDSYYKLKKKHPIDTVEKRMNNVKEFADQVFVISNTDPSPYLTCCIHLKPRETALYVRGDDMPQFPGRSVVEPLMPVKLLPYTQGVSSTMLRAEYLKELDTHKQAE